MINRWTRTNKWSDRWKIIYVFSLLVYLDNICSYVLDLGWILNIWQDCARYTYHLIDTKSFFGWVFSRKLHQFTIYFIAWKSYSHRRKILCVWFTIGRIFIFILLFFQKKKKKHIFVFLPYFLQFSIKAYFFRHFFNFAVF